LQRTTQENNRVLQCTHQDIASELGTAREVVSRMLKNFERHGWVALSRGQVQLHDETMLRQLVNGEV